MIARIGWLDHDPEERERINRVLALFQERESRDELGLAPIRDSFSEQLFPGTSVLQTRLRYFLFVPWIYQRMERERVASVDVARKSRKAEIDLIQPLVDSLDGDETGVIGRRARGALKQLPSMSYWAGMGRFGIRRFPGSQDDYHRIFDRLHRSGRTRAEDGDVVGAVESTWDPQLPPAPEGFSEGASFDLTRDEAEYRVRLQARIAHEKGGRVGEIYPSRGRRLPKHWWLCFEIIDTNVPAPYEIVWRVRNQGAEAREVNDTGHVTNDGQRHQWERLRYRGCHSMACEVWRDKKLVARAYHHVNIA